MFNSLQPHGLYSPWNSPDQTPGMGSLFLSPGYLPNLGIEPRSPALRADSLPAEPPGKPKNTGVGSLSLLQGIFPTQESNQGLLHCKWILYQLSYQGSPIMAVVVENERGYPDTPLRKGLLPSVGHTAASSCQHFQVCLRLSEPPGLRSHPSRDSLHLVTG